MRTQQGEKTMPGAWLGPQDGALPEATGLEVGLRKKLQTHKGKYHGGLFACPLARSLELGY